MIMNAQIDLGTGSTEVGVAPISTYYGYSYVQQIFTKQEINANAAGNITGLKFYLSPNADLSNSSDWTIYLGHTSKTNFTSDTDWIPATDLTQVYTGTITQNNGVVEIIFTTPFPYNNTQNLVVVGQENSSGYDSNDYSEAFYVYSLSAAGSSLYYRNDDDPFDTANPVDGSLSENRSVITILGLTPSAVPICPTVSYPANNAQFVPLSPNITWNALAGAQSYKVSIGTTPGGTDVVNQQSVATTSFTPSTPLAANTNYYLRVVAVGTGGDSTGCSEITFKSGPPVPANDECTNAVVLAVSPNVQCSNPVAGYTFGATDSGVATGTCYGNPDDDVWYQFTATTSSHMITLSNIVSMGSSDSTDTYFQVLSGACGNMSNVLCSDPDTALVTGLTPGDTYYIRVYSYGGAGRAQSFNICVGTLPPPPVNDACSGALAATTFPYSYTQADAIGATNNDGFIEVCTGGMNDGTWFTFTGDGDTYNISVSMPAGSSFDPEVGVYSGSCDNLNCEDSIDNAGSGGTENVSVATVAGTVYYVNVGHYSSSANGAESPFTININKGALGTAETTKAKDVVKVYPNPFTDILNITDISKVKSITISDVSGRQVKNMNTPSSILHLGDLKQGIYMVTLNMKDGSRQTVKVIRK
ncbi:hypothetical protein AOB46_04700 [Chryseobacterium indologenes]|uniref:Fibronectin type-III domain-containing protein n=2 Tax=Chryseobacterium indologenes TaxID=253 RepID=A0A0N0ZY10_CHRID|nr:hypothetical protein AOB46_04700 [Chryseobacterium indologenes]